MIMQGENGYLLINFSLDVFTDSYFVQNDVIGTLKVNKMYSTLFY